MSEFSSDRHRGHNPSFLSTKREPWIFFRFFVYVQARLAHWAGFLRTQPVTAFVDRMNVPTLFFLISYLIPFVQSHRLGNKEPFL